MPIAKNDSQLLLMLMKDFLPITDETTEELLKKAQENIQTEVYDAGVPSAYHRQNMNGGLKGSFEKSNAKSVGNTIESDISQNPALMVNDPDRFIHGSNYWTDSDIRNILSDIIIAGDSGTPHVGSLFGSGFWTDSRDFWTPTVNLLTNGELDKVFENGMTKRNIIWQKI